MVHIKCRGTTYLSTEIKRLILTDEQVPWAFHFPAYDPPEHNSKSLANKPWADPSLGDPSFHPRWNELDDKVNRESHSGRYTVKDGRPLNPRGRTGLKGRGVLGRWGPNHAADPIVTRWKRLDGRRQLGVGTNLPILQFCAIQRRDCSQWALPGGMVDPGEQVTETLKREFMEETMNSLEAPSEINRKLVETFFARGETVYKGYVDDPRNTDNSWMETVAVNFHDEDGASVGKFDLNAGDDAQGVKWMDVDGSLELYASHNGLVKAVVERLRAHW